LLEVKLIVDCPKQSTPMTSRSLSFRGGIWKLTKNQQGQVPTLAYWLPNPGLLSSFQSRKSWLLVRKVKTQNSSIPCPESRARSISGPTLSIS
jgi:hypothetical protein